MSVCASSLPWFAARLLGPLTSLHLLPAVHTPSLSASSGVGSLDVNVSVINVAVDSFVGPGLLLDLHHVLIYL